MIVRELYDLDQEESEIKIKRIKGYIVGRFNTKLIPQAMVSPCATITIARHAQPVTQPRSPALGKEAAHENLYSAFNLSS